jgi:acyl CoA:acetate/3-ketoacid CoA transferase
MSGKKLSILLLLMLAAIGGLAQDVAKAIPAGSKVFISPMKDEFEKDLVTAFEAKKVPLEVVTEKEKADFEISGTSESKKAGAAKILIMGSWHSSEQASITITNLKTGEAVWAYSVNKSNSAHGKRSTAEACAKHLKEKIDSKK